MTKSQTSPSRASRASLPPDLGSAQRLRMGLEPGSHAGAKGAAKRPEAGEQGGGIISGM